MRPRVLPAKVLVRCGGPARRLAIMIMKPDDLVAFSRRVYSHPVNIEKWAGDDVVGEGLHSEEKAALNDVPIRTGDLLLLGLGGGREAVPLIEMGFRVTGVDFVRELLERGLENVRKRGFAASGLVQEISELDVTPSSFDVVWLSGGMYSCVPTRARRIGMLKRIARALKPGGFFVCQFHWRPLSPASPLYDFAGRLLALITRGNRTFENGDVLWGNAEFLHFFHSEDDLRHEFEQGGFEVKSLRIDAPRIRGSAVLEKG